MTPNNVDFTLLLIVMRSSHGTVPLKTLSNLGWQKETASASSLQLEPNMQTVFGLVLCCGDMK